jgi:hypothetical protein
LLFGHRGNFVAGVRIRLASKYEVSIGDSMRRLVSDQTIERIGRGRPIRDMTFANGREPSPKPLLDNFGLPCCEGVLDRQISLRPDRRLICRVNGR